MAHFLAVQLCPCVGQAHCGCDVIMSSRQSGVEGVVQKLPTGPRYCLMTDRWNLTKQRFKKKKKVIKATSCGGELSFCLETVQNFLLETFRQLLWFIKSAYWREGDGGKKVVVIPATEILPNRMQK